MEVNAAGYYVIPRYLGWEEFLIHTRDVLACGNKMLVQFSMKEGPVQVLYFNQVHDLGFDHAYLFQISDRPRGDILIEDLSQFKFIQFRPNTEWVAIRMGSTKRINLERFDEIFISDTFRKLKPVIVLHQERFWHVMGLELASSEETDWFIYLKRQDSDFMTRIPMPRTQKFIFNPLSNSWSLDDPTEEITELEKIKKKLKSEDVSEVIVSGVPMRLIRVQEISKGVLFFVFIDTAEKRRYYYARHTTKLRIVENAESGSKEYLLDHIKAMYID